MFKSKHTITLIDHAWNIIKANIKLSFIPKRDEYIYLNEKYYKVINVVHRLNKIQDIFIVVDYDENKLNEPLVKSDKENGKENK